MSGRRPLSPPPPRPRRKVGFVDADSEESGWQLPRPVADRGLEGGAAAAAGGHDKIGAASQGPGLSAASGTSSSYEMVDMVEGPPLSAGSSPLRCHQHAGQVPGDAAREGEGPEHNSEWHWDTAEWWPNHDYWHARHPSSWHSTSWSSWRWSSTPWASSWSWWDWQPGSWAEQWVETPVEAAPVAPVETPGDQVIDWWNSDGKANESLGVDSCPTGAWEHYRMNGTSGDEVHVERTADWFRFGDGVRRLSQYRVFLEVAIKGHTGLLAVNVIDYPCPPLLSKAVCNALGMCIDCESNACEIRRLGEHRCALCVSPEGHYLIRINDFFPRNPSWHVLVHEQQKRPKLDCDEVRMFEIRQGTAVGKGSKSRLRRQALAALCETPELPNHGL